VTKGKGESVKVTSRDYGITTRRVDGVISNLNCHFCDFIVWRPIYNPGHSRSGLGKFNRMRGAMVKHLHAEHRGKLDTAAPARADQR